MRNKANKQDGRRLSSEAQEVLRRRVVRAITEGGMRPVDAVRVFGVGRTSIYYWLKRRDAGGMRALAARKRGRKSRSRLAGHEAACVVRTITERCPDQLKFPFALWTREAVQVLLSERYDLEVSVWTVGRYLNKWGLTPQKPLRRAYERDPKAVERWLKEEYPAIRRKARRQGAEIHWGDEMGMRSDHQAGRSYGRRGRTPVIRATGQRFSCNMISTITNRGRMAFMLFTKRFKAPVMLDFLRRLVRHSKRKVFLIIDGHPVHRSRKVKQWIEEHSEKITIFFLPGYCPELNPDELLNQDVKSNAVGRQNPRDRDELVSNVRSYLRSTQRRPDIIKAYFREKNVRYAAS